MKKRQKGGKGIIVDIAERTGIIIIQIFYTQRMQIKMKHMRNERKTAYIECMDLKHEGNCSLYRSGSVHVKKSRFKNTEKIVVI